MNDNGKQYIDAFDKLFDTQSLSLYKIIYSFFPQQYKKYLCILIKFAELKIALAAISETIKKEENTPSKDFNYFFECVSPYLTNDQEKLFDTFKNIHQSIKQYQDLMEMFHVMQELFPDQSSDSMESVMKTILQGGLFP